MTEEPNKTTPPIRLGIIGLGEIAKTQITALEELSQFQLVAGVDTDKAKKSKLPTGSSFYKDYWEMLSDSPVDAVVISTPYQCHFDMAVDLLKTGKHVLVEKPATETIKQFEELKELAEKSKRCLVVALHDAFSCDLLWFLKRKGKYGELQCVHSVFSDTYFNDEHKFDSLGGSWLDSGVNALSVIGKLLDLTKARIEDAHIPGYPNDVHASVRLGFNDGEAAASIDTSWRAPQKQKRTCLRFQDGAEIILDHTGQKVLTESGETLHLSPGNDRLANQYVGVFKDFLGRISTNKDNLDTAEPIHRRLFEAANQSA